MPLIFEEVLKSVFKKTIEDVLNEREQRIKTDDKNAVYVKSSPVAPGQSREIIEGTVI